MTLTLIFSCTEQKSIAQNSLPSKAQTASQGIASIRGTVREKNAVVPFVSVSLYDRRDSTKILKGVFTSSTGTFSFQALAHGVYRMRLQRVGYIGKWITCTLTESAPKIVLSDIQIEPDVKMLESIEVTAQKAIIQTTSTGFKIQASATLTQEGGTAVDLLQNVPTVGVDAEGGVTLRGKSPLILINGRNSGITNLDQIPANSIESIEVLNNPSAQYDAEAEAGIINIILKKNKQGGLNGAAALGVGYGAFGRVNSSFLLNYREGQWNIGVGYDNRFADRTRMVNGDRTNFALTDQYRLLQNRNDTRTDRAQNIRFSADYEWTTRASLGIEAIGNIPTRDNYETLITMFRRQNDVITSQNSRFSAEFQRERALELSATYRQKFADDPRRLLSIGASTSLNRETENTDITTQTLNTGSTPVGAPFLQQTRNDQVFHLSTARGDYIQPINAHTTLEVGAKSIARVLNADFRQLYNINNEYIINARASNVFDFSEYIHSAYMQWKSQPTDVPALRYEVGLRVEYWSNQGAVATTGQSFAQRYLEVFPTANMSWVLTANTMLKMSYGRRVNRPGFGQLNPFTDITDSLNQRSGNPNLQPEFVHAVETGISTELEYASVSANVYYRLANHSILPITVLRTDGVAETRPLNIGTSKTIGVEGIATYYPSKSFNINASVSLFEQNIQGATPTQDLSNRVLSWYGKMIATAMLWEGGKAQLISVYNAPVATPQGSRVAAYNTDCGFQQEVLEGKGRIGLVLTDIFNTLQGGVNTVAPGFIASRIFKVDTRSILLTFAYTFGTTFKEKLMENKYSND